MSQYNYLGKCLVSMSWSFWLCYRRSVGSILLAFWLFYSFLSFWNQVSWRLNFRLKPTNPFFLFLTPLYSGVIVLWFYSLSSSLWALLFIREIKGWDLIKRSVWDQKWGFSSAADLTWSTTDGWSSAHLWRWRWWALNAWQWAKVINWLDSYMFCIN